MVSVPAQNLSAIVGKHTRYVTLHFRDPRDVASLRYKNRAEITVFICEQKRYPVWFPCRRKTYPVECENISDM